VRQKQCTQCKETKPVSEFNKHRTTKDRLRTSCASCQREDSRQWREANKARANELSRQWREANKERAAKNRRQWQEANPKRYAYLVHRKTAKKRGIGFLLTFEEWCDWWGEDFANRGNTKGKLVMARFGDEGPYALSNIKKILHSENVREAHEFRKSKDQAVLESEV
jgi:hypothetical protein